MQIGPLRVRALTPADMPQLLRIHAASRERDLQFLPLTARQMEHFIWAQCEAQHLHHRQRWNGAEFQLVELNGVPAGRIYWHIGVEELRLLEITLLPEFRRRGFAGLLIDHLKSLAAERGVGMTLQVERANPALSLYLKLGFAICSSDPLFFQMRLASDSRRCASTAAPPLLLDSGPSTP